MNRNENQLLREDLSQVRSEYLSERSLMVEAEHAAMQAFDKAMLTLSATALGFSLTFTKFISGAGEVDPTSTYLLLLSWLLFGLTVLATICALYISHLAFRKETKRLKFDYRANSKNCLKNYGIDSEVNIPNSYLSGDWNNAWTNTTTWLNRLSIICFLAGLIFLVLYSKANFPY